MGYVFTPKEFEEGRIPTPSDYQIAMQLLKQGLAELFDKGIIYGANIHGSNFHIDGGIGSDIDTLIVMNSQEAEEHLRTLHSAVITSTYVPVEFVPISRQLAERGHHQLDYFYVRYIGTYCQDGIVGNNSLAIISPRISWQNPLQEVTDRLEAQLTKLSKQRTTLSTEHDEEHCDFLEKVIRQPIYSAIDMIRLKHGNYPSQNGRPLSKAECCKLYEQEFPQLFTSDLSLVLGTRTRYRQFLGEHKKRSLEEYRRLLEEIDGIYPNARRVIERNFEFLLDNPQTLKQ